MTYEIQDILRLTSLISTAGLDQSQWPIVLEELRQVSGAARTHLIGYDLDTGMDLGAPTCGYDPVSVEDYAAHYANLNPWVQGMLDAPSGVALSCTQLAPHHQIEKTEFYNDWVRPNEDILGGGGVLLNKTGSQMFLLGGNVFRKDIDHLEGAFISLIEMLAPHLSNAFEMNRHIAVSSAETLALKCAAGDAETGILILNARRSVLISNPQAEAMLERGNVIRRDLLGRVSFADVGDREFRTAVDMFGKPGVFEPRVFEVNFADNSPPILCRISSIDVRELDHTPAGAFMGLNENAMVVSLSQMTDGKGVRDHLTTRYRLSPQECRVALKISEGLSPQEISERHQTSVHTVRNQIRTVLQKTDSRRQSDIVRLVAMFRKSI